MSFILEALKKSEQKQRKKDGQAVRSVHEIAPAVRRPFRPWLIGFLLLLLFNGALLLWFFGPWSQASSPQLKTASTVPQSESEVAAAPGSPARTSPVDENQSVGNRQLQSVVQTQPETKSLPVPRNEKTIYSFSQLPVSIQQRIPPLKMSLHAYNRENSGASLVQLNDQILREGDMVTDRVRLEKITAEGAVLSYDGYRFLLLR